MRLLTESQFLTKVEEKNQRGRLKVRSFTKTLMELVIGEIELQT
jgi:hypothetical protein